MNEKLKEFLCHKLDFEYDRKIIVRGIIDTLTYDTAMKHSRCPYCFYIYDMCDMVLHLKKDHELKCEGVINAFKKLYPDLL